MFNYININTNLDERYYKNIDFLDNKEDTKNVNYYLKIIKTNLNILNIYTGNEKIRLAIFKYLFNDYLDNKKEFVIALRKDNYLKEYKDNFLNKDLLSSLFSDFEIIKKSYNNRKIDFKSSLIGFKGNINTIEIVKNNLLLNNKLIANFVTLSSGQKIKSNEYPKTYNLIFENFIEFNRGNRGYFKNEFNIFFNILNTVFRNRKGCKTFLYSNIFSVKNPYYSFFNYNYDKNQKYTDNEKGLFIYNQNYKNINNYYSNNKNIVNKILKDKNLSLSNIYFKIFYLDFDISIHRYKGYDEYFTEYDFLYIDYKKLDNVYNLTPIIKGVEPVIQNSYLYSLSYYYNNNIIIYEDYLIKSVINDIKQKSLL